MNTENAAETRQERFDRIKAQSEAESAARRATRAARPQVAIEMGTIVWGVFWGVFWGMWAFSLTAGVVYGLIQALSYHR